MTSLKRGSIGVVLVEPVGIVRMSLQMLFQAESDFSLLGNAEDGDGALEVLSSVAQHKNVVVLLSLELPGDRDSFWLIREIRERSPQTIVLATGTDLNRGAISQALFVGADGFIHKNSNPERFVEAARRAAAGELVLEGLPRGALGGIVDGIDRERSRMPLLTEREVSVLSVASEGLTAREIGRRLGVTERTVTTHLNHIYRKLGTTGRIAALATAMRLGLVSLSEPERVSVAAGSAPRYA